MAKRLKCPNDGLTNNFCLYLVLCITTGDGWREAPVETYYKYFRTTGKFQRLKASVDVLVECWEIKTTVLMFLWLYLLELLFAGRPHRLLYDVKPCMDNLDRCRRWNGLQGGAYSWVNNVFSGSSFNQDFLTVITARIRRMGEGTVFSLFVSSHSTGGGGFTPIWLMGGGGAVQSEHLLRGERYASCVHAGGLSCWYCKKIEMFTLGYDI